MKKLIALILCLLFLASCGGDKKEKKPEYSGFRNVGDESIIMDPARWGELNVHDPVILKDGDMYYAFSTDASYGDVHKPGIQIRSSMDLITWEYEGTAFENFEEDCAEAIAHSKCVGLWAPDVVKVGNKYRMYFSASTFGSSRSCISLAEADKPQGPYEYRGIVYRSEVNAVSGPNAIDPSIITDKNGVSHMAFGSFSGGIFIVELDDETGFMKDEFEKPKRIAGSRGAAIEAPALVYIEESDYYYLFVSYGSLSSDYNIRVGRSREIGGPYLDANGNSLASLGPGNEDKIGTKLMGGYTFLSDPGPPQSKGYMAPGHNGVLIDGDDYYIAHHTRTYTLPDYWFYMNVRSFWINSFGWPVIAPNRYYGEESVPADLGNGTYAFVEHLSDSNKKNHKSVRIELKDGVISGAAEGSYKIYDNYRVELTINGIVYDGIVQREYDWERKTEVDTFTAMSETGLCVWGCTQL